MSWRLAFNCKAAPWSVAANFMNTILLNSFQQCFVLSHNGMFLSM